MSNVLDNLVGGQERVGGGGAPQRYVGLGAVRLLAINPTKEKMEEMLGTEINNAPNYDAKPGRDGGAPQKPLIGWFENIETGEVFSTYITAVSNVPISNKNGDKFIFINKQGQISYYAPSAEVITSNPKTKWYKPDGMRKLNVGENVLYELFQAFILYNANAEGANFLETMDQLNINANAIMNGDMSGINQFVDYINEKGNILIASHVVSVGEYQDESGETRKTIRQQILTDKDTYFRTQPGETEVTNYMIQKLQNYEKSQQAAGYSVTNKEYFVGPLRPWSEDIPTQEGPSTEASTISTVSEGGSFLDV